MITITNPVDEPTVPPNSPLTFSGDNGPAVSHEVKPAPAPAAAPYPARASSSAAARASAPADLWSITITAPAAPGNYIFTVFGGAKDSASKGFTVA